MKSNNDVPQENKEFLEHVRMALLLVHGKHYSLEQIHEAYTIALLATAIFRDQITKINRRRYGCAHE